MFIDAICHNKKGTIAYDEFLSFALNIDENDEVVEIHLKLQKIIFKRSKMKLKDLLKLFSTSKTFSKGYVRNSEFQNILRKISSKISVKDIEILIAHLDTDKEGTIDFNYFSIWLYTGIVQDEVRETFFFFIHFGFHHLSTSVAIIFLIIIGYHLFNFL